MLIDLRMARAIKECKQRPAPGGIFEYMPPELALRLPTTYKGDILSLGLLLRGIITLRGLAQG